MIGRICGILLEKRPPQVLIDVHGIGYEINVPMTTFYNLPLVGQEVSLYTQFVVREDAQLLFGFSSEEERHVFRQLLKISGVGARTALTLLSGLSVADLQRAIADQDSGRLVKIPGIGKKTAERLLLELRDKLDVRAIANDGTTTSAGQGDDALNTLLALGYNEREANWAIKQLAPNLLLADRIKQALKLLSKA
jgi:holliday junction DNA helicase RuvA